MFRVRNKSRACAYSAYIQREEKKGVSVLIFREREQGSGESAVKQGEKQAITETKFLELLIAPRFTPWLLLPLFLGLKKKKKKGFYPVYHY